MAPGDVRKSFQDLVSADRKKKQHEALASQLLGKGRRTSTPTTGRVTGPGASLASRVGVIKRSASVAPKPSINGQWTHDLHDLRGGRPRMSTLRTQSTSKLERENRLQSSLHDGPGSQVNIRSSGNNGQLSIRGLASNGPYVVMASNFASGTTAADIESAMAPIGLSPDGEQCITRCRILTSTPTVLAEIEFSDRHAAENVIATFNGQKADGRVLYVYMKPGGPTPIRNERPAKPTPAPREDTPPPVNDEVMEDTSDLVIVDTVGDRQNDPRNESGRLDSRDDRRDGSYQDGRYGYDERGSSYSSRGRGGRSGRPDYGPPRQPRSYDDRGYGPRRRY
ncbi:hypothetical protein FH972_021809 [Carpinus fangiana]|uniref:RRM domain-containing protein n=1 Tax=Carpinus fangiana TaxID=176857 RepID=A0A5N6KQF2_9ROSI|nr:hypothetical protein FH972_021809 [Carpinus fangiana]